MGLLPDDKRKIILVDDSELEMGAIKFWLERRGVSVRSFTSPYKALEVIGQTPDEFHCVITDYRMPSMRGTKLASQIKEVNPKMPIILMSSDISEIDKDDERFVAIIQKGDTEQLKNTLTQLGFITKES